MNDSDGAGFAGVCREPITEDVMLGRITQGVFFAAISLIARRV